MSGSGGQNPRLPPNQCAAQIAPNQYAAQIAPVNPQHPLQPPPPRPQNPPHQYGNPGIRLPPPPPNQYGNPGIRPPPPPPNQYGNPGIRPPPPPPNQHASLLIRLHGNPTSELVRSPPPPQHAPPSAASGIRPPPPSPLSRGKRPLEDPEPSDSGRIKRVTGPLTYYTPVLNFFAEHAPTEPHQFFLGCSFGSIPDAVRPKTTPIGADVLDGCFEFLSERHAAGFSFGGDFDPDDVLVSEKAPHRVTFNKKATLPATILNMSNDFEKLVDSVVIVRYGEEGERPAYVEDLIAQVKRLRTSSSLKQWSTRAWVVRNHPLFVQSGKRRLLLEDFYKFYKTLDPASAAQLFTNISGHLYERWQVLIARDDDFLSAVYWKGRPEKCPQDHFVRDYFTTVFDDEENENVFRFTSEHGFLAIFLRHFLVHGPEESMILPHDHQGELWYGVGLEELDLIIAYYFGEFLSTFIDEISGLRSKYDMAVALREQKAHLSAPGGYYFYCRQIGQRGDGPERVDEMLRIYAARRSVSLQVDG